MESESHGLIFISKYEGADEFWNTDEMAKFLIKEEAFLHFIKDAGITVLMIRQGVAINTQRISRMILAEVLLKLGSDSETAWGLMLCNLVYTPAFNWFVTKLPYK